MSRDFEKVVVAGYVCLDIIPKFATRQYDTSVLFTPNKLMEVGPVTTVAGGVVSNTGVALHQLGVPTCLTGKVGDDVWGCMTQKWLHSLDPALTEGLIVVEGAHSSYTVVIDPPKQDRFFLHFPGPNETYNASDVPYEKLGDALLFHFGYPPLMPQLFANGGQQLETLLSRVKLRGVTTSLDMTLPDPETDAGQIDWLDVLARVLPYVDLFLPSLEEILFMLDRSLYRQVQKLSVSEGAASIVDGELLSKLATRLLDLGPSVVVFKLGDQGLYVRTTEDATRLAAMGRCAPQDIQSWVSRELLVPAFRVQVSTTTGAGDSAVAGFLAGVFHRLPLDDVMTIAAAAGACRVEETDVVGSIPSFSVLQDRIRAGWERCPVVLPLQDWHWDKNRSMWIGPKDVGGD